MSHNYVTVHVTGTSALDITVARTPQIPVHLSETNGRGLISKECIARAPFSCVHGEDIRKLTEKVAILAKLTYCR